MALVQIIDDEPKIRKLLRVLLERMGHTVVESSNGSDGIADFHRHRPALTFCDITLPNVNGLDVLQSIRADDPAAAVIVMSGESTTERAIRAMSLGAADYLVKPFEPGHAMHLARLILDEAPRIQSPDSSDPSRHAILGRSKGMCDVYKSIGRSAVLDSAVLILGESGTGKELVARAIHEYGPRKRGPFVAINCAAIPEALLESELFGYEKGAFSGADRQRPGKFELAHDGTLFLDEIGEMSPALQAKMLRVLQDQEFYRVGGNELIRTNARIVAATNRELIAESERRDFREDLYYRLSSSVIRLPPLRERREDIPLLVDHFLRLAGAEQKRAVHGVSPEALNRLVQHSWRGNVRELANTIRQAVILSHGHTLHDEHVSGVLGTAASPRATGDLFDPNSVRTSVAKQIAAGKVDILPGMLAEYERAILETAIRECGGNTSLCAKHLGIHRITLKTKLSGLQPEAHAVG